uniref:Integrase core domain containing protein n=1 Tax=Solanum tuberosum TaxID=4113 RepID=M1DE12_SOLTU
MENSVEQKAATIKRFIDTTVILGRKEILDGFTARSRVVIEKEAIAATRSNATTSLTHDFINSLQPCLLASSKPLPVMSLTPFSKCVNHGFAAHISLEDVQNSENYTRVARFGVCRKVEKEAEINDDQVKSPANFTERDLYNVSSEGIKEWKKVETQVKTTDHFTCRGPHYEPSCLSWSKGAPLIPYDLELQKTLRRMVTAQELEAQRERLGLEAEVTARGVQQNGGNNQPRVVDENRGVDGLVPPQRKPIAPRGRA